MSFEFTDGREAAEKVLAAIRDELLDDHRHADEEGVRVGIVHAIRVVERWQRKLTRGEQRQ